MLARFPVSDEIFLNFFRRDSYREREAALTKSKQHGEGAEAPRRRGRPNIHEDVPVSLAPLDFETALAGLLQVSPEPEKRPTAKKQPAKKRASKKR
jgi:hypothetical protein